MGELVYAVDAPRSDQLGFYSPEMLEELDFGEYR